MKIKKIICLALLFVMIASTMLFAQSCSSCKGPKEETTLPVGTTAPSTGTNKLEPNLPDVKYEEYEFTIANSAYGASKYTYSYITAEEDSADPIISATFKRNQKILDQFDVTIIEENIDTDQFLTVQGSQDDTYDLATADLSSVMKIVTKGYSLDFNTVETIDLDMPWWDQNARVKLALGDKLYYTFSDATIYALDNTRATYFNKDLISELGLEDPFTLLSENKWTVEKMVTMGKDAVSDLNGDTVFDKNDRYGIANQATMLYEALLTGCDAEIIKQGSDGIPYFCCFDDKDYFVEVYTYLLDSFNKDNVYFLTGNEASKTMFIEGKSLFFVNTLNYAAKLRGEDVSFGILPIPKYKAEQENYYHVSPNPHAMLIPNTASDTGRTGVILEALSYYSSSYYSDEALIPAYFQITLKDKSAKDEQSAESLQIIHDSVSYVNKIIGTEFTSKIFVDYFGENNKGIASYLAQQELSQKLILQTTVDNLLDR